MSHENLKIDYENLAFDFIIQVQNLMNLKLDLWTPFIAMNLGPCDIHLPYVS